MVAGVRSVMVQKFELAAKDANEGGKVTWKSLAKLAKGTKNINAQPLSDVDRKAIQSYKSTLCDVLLGQKSGVREKKQSYIDNAFLRAEGSMTRESRAAQIEVSYSNLLRIFKNHSEIGSKERDLIFKTSDMLMRHPGDVSVKEFRTLQASLDDLENQYANATQLKSFPSKDSSIHSLELRAQNSAKTVDVSPSSLMAEFTPKSVPVKDSETPPQAPPPDYSYKSKSVHWAPELATYKS